MYSKNVYTYFFSMFREDEENKYYDGNDLLESQKKILFQKFTEAIKTQQ